MSPAEKQALDAKAASAGHISASELVRRAVEAYDEQAAAEAAELREWLSVLALGSGPINWIPESAEG
jgi:hypothetical protein